MRINAKGSEMGLRPSDTHTHTHTHTQTQNYNNNNKKKKKKKNMEWMMGKMQMGTGARDAPPFPYATGLNGRRRRCRCRHRRHCRRHRSITFYRLPRSARFNPVGRWIRSDSIQHNPSLGNNNSDENKCGNNNRG